MLNGEVKQRFLKTYFQNKATRNSAYKVLWQAGKCEEELNKDLRDMSFNEAQAVLDSIGGTKTSSSTVKLSTIRAYVKWCNANGMETTDAFMRVTLPGLDKIRTHMISGPKDLAIATDQYFGTVPEDECSDNVVRCIFWLAYMGVHADDVAFLTTDNIDLEKMELLYDGARLPIYRESYAVFRNVVTLDSFVYDHPNYSAGKIRRQRKQGNSLLRSVRGSFDSTKSVLQAIGSATAVAKRRNVTRRLSYNNIMVSGYFYRAYELERAGLEPGLFDIAEAGVRRRSEGERTEEEIIRVAKERTNEMIIDYKRWKLAFDRF